MLLIEFADGTRLKMVGFGDAEGFGRQPDGLEVTELCGLNATMTPKTRRLVRSRRLPALRKSSDASRIELVPCAVCSLPTYNMRTCSLGGVWFCTRSRARWGNLQ